MRVDLCARGARASVCRTRRSGAWFVREDHGARKDDAMRIQLDANAVAASQWEISGLGNLGDEITRGPPPRFGCHRWILSVHSKGLENGAGSHMSAFLEMRGTEEQLGDDTSICPDFEATPPKRICPAAKCDDEEIGICGPIWYFEEYRRGSVAIC